MNAGFLLSALFIGGFFWILSLGPKKHKAQSAELKRIRSMRIKTQEHRHQYVKELAKERERLQKLKDPV